MTTTHPRSRTARLNRWLLVCVIGAVIGFGLGRFWPALGIGVILLGALLKSAWDIHRRDIESHLQNL